MEPPSEPRWLLLIHQIPPKPAYLRVKVGRRLQRLGAVAIKNSVYALPKSDPAIEDLQWVVQEIVKGGGEASLCEASFVDGLSDGEIESLFRAARKLAYDVIAAEARRIENTLPKRGQEIRPTVRVRTKTLLARLSKQLGEVNAIDFFGSPAREVAARLVAGVGARLKPEEKTRTGSMNPVENVHGRTWVTRKDIHVDRMASAWLVRRFIDDKARFKFVPAKAYRPEPGELRFDMFEAEFTHEGDHCTFEVLLSRFSIEDPALRSIAEIIHDIDLKDSKYGRQDALGFERLVTGIAMAHADDKVRLDRAGAVLDDLYAYFSYPER